MSLMKCVMRTVSATVFAVLMPYTLSAQQNGPRQINSEATQSVGASFPKSAKQIGMGQQLGAKGALSASSLSQAPAKLPQRLLPSSYEKSLKAKIDTLRSRVQPASSTANAGASALGNAPGQLASNFPGFSQTPAFFAGDRSDGNQTLVGLTIDANQDGKPDLVTFHADGELVVSLNPGTGSLTNWAVTSINTAAVNVGVYFLGAQAVDVNHDGYPDIVATDLYNSAAFVYLNKKDGTFADPVEFDLPFSSVANLNYGGSILAADVNGDGIPDLAAVGFNYAFDQNGVPNATISLLIRLGKGDGTFATPLPEQDATLSGYLTQERWQNVVAADMNKDGKVDLVVPFGTFDANGNSLTVVSVLTGNGNGTFNNLPTSIPATGTADTGSFYLNQSDAVADIDGDGNPDFIFSGESPGIWVAYGNGDGTVRNPVRVLQQPGTTYSASPTQVGFADVTGDGILDVISYDYGFTAVYAGQKGGTFSPAPIAQIVSGLINWVAAEQQPAPADFNGDGSSEIAVLDQDTHKIGFYQYEHGTFPGALAVAPTGQTAENLATVASADFNNDSYPDIVVQDFSAVDLINVLAPDIKLGLNDGKGNFTYSTIIPSAIAASSNVISIYSPAADFNKDGKVDLALELTTGIGISFNNGDGTFTVPTVIGNPLNLSCPFNSVDVGDVNGDGLPDIVAAYEGDSTCNAYPAGSTPSGFAVFLNQGGGKFSSSFLPFGFQASYIKLADLNEDGKLDMLLVDANSNQSYYFLYDMPGNGDGTFNVGAAQSLMESTFVASLAVADFDGDGKLDIAAGVVTQVDANGVPVFGTTGNYLMRGNGDFSFQLPNQYSAGSFAVGAVVADFNGDGRPDIAISGITFVYYTDIPTENFSTLVNLGGMAFAPGPPVFAAANSVGGNIFAADYNGDGAIDVLASPVLQGGYQYAYLSELFPNQGAISLALTASLTSIPQGSNVSLQAVLTPGAGSNSPTGTITFFDNGSLVGIVPVGGSAASITLGALTVGQHVLTATYSGDSNFNGTSSKASVTITVTALAPSFTISQPIPSTLTLQAGQTGVLTLVLGSNATFSGNIALTCSGMPAESSCAVTPASLTMAGAQSATVSVVVATTSKNSTYSAGNVFPTLFGGSGSMAVGCLLMIASRRRRKMLPVSMLFLTLALSGAMFMTISGCAGQGGNPGTPTGISTLTVQAQSGNITQKQTFVLKLFR